MSVSLDQDNPLEVHHFVFISTGTLFVGAVFFIFWPSFSLLPKAIAATIGSSFGAAAATLVLFLAGKDLTPPFGLLFGIILGWAVAFELFLLTAANETTAIATGVVFGLCSGFWLWHKRLVFQHPQSRKYCARGLLVVPACFLAGAILVAYTDRNPRSHLLFFCQINAIFSPLFASVAGAVAGCWRSRSTPDALQR